MDGQHIRRLDVRLAAPLSVYWIYPGLESALKREDYMRGRMICTMGHERHENEAKCVKMIWIRSTCGACEKDPSLGLLREGS